MIIMVLLSINKSHCGAFALTGLPSSNDIIELGIDEDTIQNEEIVTHTFSGWVV